MPIKLTICKTCKKQFLQNSQGHINIAVFAINAGGKSKNGSKKKQKI